MLQWIDILLKFIGELIGPFIIAVGSFLIFACVDQTKEVYRVISLDSDIFQAVLAVFLVGILSASVWYSAYLLYSTQSNSNSKPQDHQECKKILALFLGYMPFLGLSLGIFLAQKNLQDTELLFGSGGNIALLIFANALIIGGLYSAYRKNPRSIEEIIILFVDIVSLAFTLISLPLIIKSSSSIWGVICIVIVQLSLYMLLYILFLILKRKQENLKTNLKKIERNLKNIKRNAIVFAFIFPVIYIGSIHYLLPPNFSTFLPVFIGPISLVAISLTILLVGLTIIQKVGDENKFPAITFLIVLVVFNGFTNWNDNHKFRQLSQSTENSTLELPTLTQSFEKWLSSRPDRDKYPPGKPYPVYIASAQGGGIYAAYNAAMTFAKLADEIPSFSQHVFAISGVSGGSLGASVFASLLKASDDNNQAPIKYADNAKKMLAQDLLSPLLALGLFPDLIQRFIPLLSINAWDRANGLEIAFENAWDKLKLKDYENPFRQSFYKHWQPENTSPALVLNTTVVETGERMLISPFTISPLNQANVMKNSPGFPFVLEKRDLRLSTAVGLSARFPYITPVGWYQHSEGSKLHLADGGYFDNSGVSTAIDIGRALQQMDEKENRFKVIYLALVDSPISSSTKELKNSNFNEVLSPIRALFRAREARTRNIVELSTYTLSDSKFRTLMLQKTRNSVKLPLGWLLSKKSQNFIDQQIRNLILNLNPCDEANFTSIPQTYDELVNHNSCVAQSINDDLRVEP